VSYRDDLDAALSRIHALEERLAEAHRDSGKVALDEATERFERSAKELEQASETLSAENARMAVALAEVQKQHREAKSELEELRAKFHGVVPTRRKHRRYLSLVDHNRQSRSRSYGDRRAGVSCPTCLFFDEEVELVNMGTSSQFEGAGERFSGVVCPKCGYSGRKREAPQ
jgi:exonuclease VII small subunit